MLHDQKAALLGAPALHWYVIAGATVGGLVFALTASIILYKCYQIRFSRRSSSYNSGRLSSAIKKGLKESNAKPPNTLSGVKNTHGAGGSSSSSDDNYKDNSKHLKRSPTGTGGAFTSSGIGGGASQSYKTETYIINEKDKGVISPTQKDESLREKGVDEQKLTKLGNLYFNVEYDSSKTALLVSILKACDLPPKDANQESSDPYVKLQLLPEKRHKVKTRVLRKTLNPTYDEIFTFYGIDYNQLQSMTLHFVVLSFDRYSRDDIIGEVLYPLNSVDFNVVGEVQMCKEIAPRHIKMHSAGRGELLVSLCYQPVANRLTVVVLKARNLPKMDIAGLSDPYVKIYLSYNGQRIAKKKTHVKKRTLNPVFNESFLFDVPSNEGLQNISLEFQVLDWDRMMKNEVVGKLEIAAKMEGLEGQHWEEVINCPRKQIAEWHKLKEG